MASVGAYLRELRTRRGVSLEELARTTRVAQRYLEALESDAFKDLPAPVFIRGFIRAYCQALGEPPTEALACYDGQDGRAPQPPVRAIASAGPPTVRGESRAPGAIGVSFVLMVILGMALFTVALVLRPGDRMERPMEARPEPRPVPLVAAENDRAPSTPMTSQAPSPAQAPAPVAPISQPATGRSPASLGPSGATPPGITATPTVVARPPASGAAPAPPSETPSAAPASAPSASVASPTPALRLALGSVSSPYRLVARTSEPTWIRVRTEDGRTSEETVPAGVVREWVSDRPFVLTVGNAGGVSFELNGRAFPPLGARGVVVPRLVVPPDAR
jgi:cytoskeleton protein RodZ